MVAPRFDVGPILDQCWDGGYFVALCGDGKGGFVEIAYWRLTNAGTSSQRTQTVGKRSSRTANAEAKAGVTFVIKAVQVHLSLETAALQYLVVAVEGARWMG